MPGISDFLRKLRRAARDERGGALPLVAVGVPMLFGAGAVGFDVAHLYAVRGQLQTTADIASRTAVNALPDEQAAIELAIEYAQRNMGEGDHGQVLSANDIEIGRWDLQAGSFTRDGTTGVPSVRVVTRRSRANGNAVALALAPVLGVSEGDVTAASTAARVSDARACVLSLANSGAGIAANGNVTINASQCGLAANSSSAWAMAVEGASASIDIGSLHLTGGLSDGHGTVRTTGPQQINTGRTLRDPYADRDFTADIPTSESPTANADSKPNNTVNLEPGVYPDDVEWKGEVNLAPGVYVMKNNLDIGAQARVRGEDVTLVIEDPDVEINGGAEVQLSAPTTGSTRGIAMLRDGSMSGIDMGGGSGLRINGAIYMPSSSITFRGTSQAGGCLQIVANRVFLGGNPTFEHNCGGTATEPIEIQSVKLVN